MGVPLLGMSKPHHIGFDFKLETENASHFIKKQAPKNQSCGMMLAS